jgi:hypothetical protein
MGEPLRLDTPSSPSYRRGEDGLAVALDMLIPSEAGPVFTSRDRRVALRTSSGSRRKSSPLTPADRRQYRKTLPSGAPIAKRPSVGHLPYRSVAFVQKIAVGWRPEIEPERNCRIFLQAGAPA